MKHYSRYLPGVSQQAIREIAEVVERKQREKDGYMKLVDKVETEIYKLENEAFEGFLEGGFTTTEIAEAKDKAFRENSKTKR